MQERKEENVDVLISGLGPAGLGTAIEALRAGKTVGIIFNRPENDFNRQQRVILEKQARDYLLSIFHSRSLAQVATPEDVQFIAMLDNLRWTPIAEIEKFLFRELFLLSADNIKRFNQLVPLRIYYESTLVEVIIQQGIATIQSTKSPAAFSVQQRIHFNFLVGADGANHHAVDVANQSLTKKIVYSTDFLSIFNKPHRYHVGMKDIAYEMPGAIPEKNDEETHIGVSPDNFYYSIVTEKRAGTNKAICHINCELPANLYNEYYAMKGAVVDSYNNDESKKHTASKRIRFEEANKKIVDYIKNKIMLIPHLPGSICIPTDSGNAPILSLFLSILKQASKAAVVEKGPSGCKKVFFLIGDSYRTAYYPLGSNLNIAFKQIECAAALFHCPPEKLESEAIKYNSKCSEFASETKSTIRKALWVGKRQSWGYGTAVINLIYASYRSNREHPHVHNLARDSVLIELEKLPLKELMTKDIAGMNILHKAMAAGAIETISWLASTDERQVIFLTLLFENASLLGQSQNTPITSLMTSTLLLESEKANTFNAMIMAALKAIKAPNMPADCEQNNLAHLAAKYSMPYAVAHLAKEVKCWFSIANHDGQTPIQIAVMKLYDSISCPPEMLKLKNIAAQVETVIVLVDKFPQPAQDAAHSTRDVEGLGLAHHFVRLVIACSSNFYDYLALFKHLVTALPSLAEARDKQNRKPSNEFYTRGEAIMSFLPRQSSEEKLSSTSLLSIPDTSGATIDEESNCSQSQAFTKRSYSR